MSAPLLDFPSEICPMGVTITLSHTTGESPPNPYTREQSFDRWPGEQWSFDFRLPPYVDEDVADEIISFALKLKGKYGTFLVGDPSRSTPRGVGGGTPVVNGGSQQGDTLEIDGCPLNTLQWLKKGDWFQLGSGSSARLHKLVEDADTDGSGNATLTFVPDLRESPSDGAAITITNARGLFRVTTDDTSWSKDPRGGPQSHITRIQISALEVL